MPKRSRSKSKARKPSKRKTSRKSSSKKGSTKKRSRKASRPKRGSTKKKSRKKGSRKMSRGKNPWMDLLNHIRPILKKKGITNVSEVSAIAKKHYAKGNKDLAASIKSFNESQK